MKAEVKSKIMEKTGLFEKPEGVLSGIRDSFPVSVYYVQGQDAYFIMIDAAKPGKALDELAQFTEEMKGKVSGLMSMTEQNAHITCVVNNLGTEDETVQSVSAVVNETTAYLMEHGFTPCCGYCGKTETTLKVRDINHNFDHICDECFGKLLPEQAQTEVKEQKEEIQKKKKGNLVTGLVGAFLGALIGAVLWIIIYQMGYIAGIAGLVMSICALKGYEMFCGHVSKIGVVVSMIIVFVMIFIAQNISMAMEIYNTFKDSHGITFWDAYRSIPEFLKESEVSAAFYKDLAFGYVLTIVASFSSIRNMFKTGTTKKI